MYPILRATILVENVSACASALIRQTPRLPPPDTWKRQNSWLRDALRQHASPAKSLQTQVCKPTASSALQTHAGGVHERGYSGGSRGGEPGDSQRIFEEQAVWGAEAPRSIGPKWRKSERLPSSSRSYAAIFLKNRKGEGEGTKY